MIIQAKIVILLLPVVAAIVTIAAFIAHAERAQAEYRKPKTVQQQRAMPRDWVKSIKEYRQ